MLNGIDPVLIVTFSKISPTAQSLLSRIPVVSDFISRVGLPPIPIYLSRELTGIIIDSEDKSIDMNTSNETLADGEKPKQDQKGINSTIRINMSANRESIGVTLLAALMDQCFEKATSKEYSISYLHNATTIFNGLLNSFNITQNSDDTRVNISLEIAMTTAKAFTKEEPKIPVVERSTGPIPQLNGT